MTAAPSQFFYTHADPYITHSPSFVANPHSANVVYYAHVSLAATHAVLFEFTEQVFKKPLQASYVTGPVKLAQVSDGLFALEIFSQPEESVLA